MYVGEQGYLDLMRDVMEKGVVKTDRTGTGTRELFSQKLRFDLSDGTVPIYTTKRVYWKTALREMLWMFSGSRNIKPLLEQNVHIWTAWPHAKYERETGNKISLDDFENRILGDETFAAEWGDTGGAYGYMWRHWPVYEEIPSTLGDPYCGKTGEVDQIQQIIDTLKNSPDSRRIILEGWNVGELPNMMLPPCHKTYQFLTGEDGKLNLALTIRSNDLGLGNPFNVFNAAVFLRLMALHTGHSANELTVDMVSAHIYSNHEAMVSEQITRTPGAQSKLLIRKADSFFDQKFEDFTVEGYEPQGKLSAPVAV